MLLIIVLFCCVAPNANSQCFGAGTVASSFRQGDINSPNPSASFSVPYYPWLIKEITTYHAWVLGNQPPAQVHMTITDDAGNIYYEEMVPFVDETQGTTVSGWFLGHVKARPNIVLPEGNYMLALDAWKSWSRGIGYDKGGANSYDIYGNPCPSTTREQCLACG